MKKKIYINPSEKVKEIASESLLTDSIPSGDPSQPGGNPGEADSKRHVVEPDASDNGKPFWSD